MRREELNDVMREIVTLNQELGEIETRLDAIRAKVISTHDLTSDKLDSDGEI